MNPRGHWAYSHRIPREKVDSDVHVGWSEWRRIMKPTQHPANPNPRYKSRFPEPGFRLKTESFPDYFTGCGVYELMVLKSRMELVVYIGSTCQKKRDEGWPLVESMMRNISSKPLKSVRKDLDFL